MSDLDRLKADALDVGKVIRREFEAASELASRQLREGLVFGHLCFPQSHSGPCASMNPAAWRSA